MKNMEEKISRFMSNMSVPRLSEEQMQSCDGILKEAEVVEALKQLKSGSAP